MQMHVSDAAMRRQARRKDGCAPRAWGPERRRRQQRKAQERGGSKPAGPGRRLIAPSASCAAPRRHASSGAQAASGPSPRRMVPPCATAPFCTWLICAQPRISSTRGSREGGPGRSARQEAARPRSRACKLGSQAQLGPWSASLCCEWRQALCSCERHVARAPLQGWRRSVCALHGSLPAPEAGSAPPRPVERTPPPPLRAGVSRG